MPAFVVLGAGPTGLFAADWISRNIDPDVVTVGARSMGMLEPVEFDGRLVTILPVFPQRDQVFPKIRDEGPDLVLTHAGSPAVPECRVSPAPHSYAARAMREFAPASLSLAWKQFGRRIWQEPLLEVQRKVERTYSATSAKSPVRIGYVRGESPYAHELRTAIRRLRVINARPIEITDDRTIVLDNQMRLPYRHIINTLPLPTIARILKLPDPGGAFAAAKFLLAHIVPTVPSRLIYDLDPGSLVFRVLTPCADIALVQLSLSHACVAQDVLRGRVECLLGVKVIEFHPHSFSFPRAYPLDPPSARGASIIAATAESCNMLNIGRFAEWRYIDLHEISWEKRLGCIQNFL